MTYDVLPADKAGLAGGLIIEVAGFGTRPAPCSAASSPTRSAGAGSSSSTCRSRRSPVTRPGGRSRRTGRGARERIDYPGIATLSVGLMLIALDQVTGLGLGDPRILGLFALCVLLVAFGVIERRAGSWALIPRT